MLTTVLCLVITVSGSSQDPQDSRYDVDEPSWTAPTFERLATLEKVEAKARLAQFKKAFKTKDPIKQIEALNDLVSKGRHPTMVPPLTKALNKSKSTDVREHAAYCLGRLGYAKAASPLLKAFQSKSNKGRGTVRQAAATALGLVADKPKFKKLAHRFRGGDRFDKCGLAMLAGYSKDLDAVGLLAEWINAPEPVNPNSASNPPAEYWQARWKEWHYIKNQVRWSLWAITGCNFVNQDEARDWQKEQKKKKKKKGSPRLP